MELTALEGLSQRLAGADHLLLSHEFVEIAWPHAVRERPQAIIQRRIAQQVLLRIAGAGFHGTARLPSIQLIHTGQRDTPR
jgi:hypothetical protein